MSDYLTQPWNYTRPSHRINREAAVFDAFGRVRVSEPVTLFDSKLSSGKLGCLWDEVTIGTASAVHDDVDACVNMSVAADGDVAIRQTFQRWNYQPGKSQLFLGTAVMPTASGVTARLGLFHGNYAAPHAPHDGLYFEIADGVMSVNVLKGTESGGVVSLASVPQSQWNMDRLDGTGPSGAVADWSKAQIFQIDYQWLGVGGVRFGVEVDSVMVYVHEERHAGLITSVYMSNASQPVRYEIRSTGGAGTLMAICSSVSSEGGAQKTGISTAVDTNGTLISCAASPTVTMMLAVRLDPAKPDAQMLLEKVYVLNTAANTSYRWVLLRNPTIVGTPNWIADSALPSLQVWRNEGTAITMTDGMLLDAGYAARDARVSNQTTNPSIGPGVSIAGTSDIVALGIESIGGTSTCSGGIGLRQLV